ncbi:MAG: GNAT family N-acetyltransferase [Flavobacteriales bacterium]|jgi:RimJ/RimL family protein N-acetyltransferase
MIFPTTYNCLTQNKFELGEYKIVPIRYEDRIEIMKWRNEQLYHLRQAEPLTEESQDNYFRTTVASLFELENPSQILFSYLKDEVCIGYGGLVHINWVEKIAEVSFIMNTELEKTEFELHWSNFLRMLKKIAFQELKWNKIFTYAYNLRPHLYPVLEKNEFEFTEKNEKVIEVNGDWIAVLIHECNNPKNHWSIRKCQKNDMELVFNWSSEKLVRSQSFNSTEISKEVHEKWFATKLRSDNSLMLVNEFKNEPAGLVRFDIEEINSVVGILMDKKFRSKGLSFLMLEKSSKAYFETFSKPILAFIKESNIASIKTFEKAGFKFLKKDVVNEFPTLVYKLEKNG